MFGLTSCMHAYIHTYIHTSTDSKKVKVYRLVTRKTYESQLFVKACQKLALDQVVLGGMEKNNPLSQVCQVVLLSS